MMSLDQTRLHELEELCVQEQPPACMSGCPLHVDGRSICSAIAAGDFDSALEIYKKTVPFPGIVSSLCSGHCSGSCRRKEAGDAIELRGLEEAAWKYGKEKKKRIFLPKRSNRAAIVGGGISGLTAALELAKKGCRVTVYEKEERIGGMLLTSGIPEEVAEKDFSLLKEYPITIKYKEAVEDITALAKEYDALYIAWGKQQKEVEAFSSDENTYGMNTDTAGQENIFAGGYGISRQVYDVALSMADGKRAAISIDRYLKQVSMTAGREKEGIFETGLFVNMEETDCACTKTQPPFSKEEAKEEAARCLDCKCLECVKACAFLREYKTFPRKYVREVYNNLSIAMGNRHANRMINSCSLCGQCSVICPYGLDTGMVTGQARQMMAESKKMPPSSFEFGLRDMNHANSKELSLLRHAPGFCESRYLFFPGCQLGASAPEAVFRVYEDLCSRLQGGVGLFLGCCGIVADWAGEKELFQEITGKLKKSWVQMGKPVVITACPTCYRVWKQELPEVQTEGIWSLLEEWEEFAPVREGHNCKSREKALTVMDACGAREFEEIHAQVRRLLTKTGYRLLPHTYEKKKSGCCGFGGLMPVSNRRLSQIVAEEQTKDKERLYLTYCMNCRDRYTGTGAKSIHLLELFYQTGEEKHIPPTWSDRQRRRRWLKQRLLQEIWKENNEGREEMKLYYSDEMKEQMEERMILEEDLEEAIKKAEETGEKILDMSENCMIAGRRIENVYFWVYYRESKDGYEILKAYSHRMNFR